ncbi:MAG: Transposase [Candidatus Midichloria mitochondrii]|uniref:Uncharacterized protein n=2 Tax=Candidatus Midichloria mitochondrii TaxID=234827 RepID=F7XWM2_MIDMI|nr:hypothetical protein midi_00781 [Candidatus Midichloria mitochondrii IricVA]MDJ1288472.1 hypothetical protein [Candidatus Midichloria mitochondrii]
MNINIVFLYNNYPDFRWITKYLSEHKQGLLATPERDRRKSALEHQINNFLNNQDCLMAHHFFGELKCSTINTSIQSLNDSSRDISAVPAYSRIPLDLVKQNVINTGYENAMVDIRLR